MAWVVRVRVMEVIKFEGVAIYNKLARALWTLANSSGGAACPGTTRGQPRGSTSGVRERFQGDLSKKKAFNFDGSYFENHLF